jgi:2-hydroxychromene-2-carboxylate isomerase
MAADLDFHFDPVCPFAWITSRWVTHVQEQRDYDVDWRFISLWMLNEKSIGSDWYTPQYRAGHFVGHQGLRIADAIRLGESDPSAVGRWYTAAGAAIHVDGVLREARKREEEVDPRAFYTGVLKEAGFDVSYVDAIDDDSHDEHLRAETELALSRAGDDVGTPVLAYRPGTDAEMSFFGPVISKAPRGEEAVRLWDAIETLAASRVAELKRSFRDELDFT